MVYINVLGTAFRAGPTVYSSLHPMKIETLHMCANMVLPQSARQGGIRLIPECSSAKL